eukprot:4622092-Amphidinium_carterae.1
MTPSNLCQHLQTENKAMCRGAHLSCVPVKYTNIYCTLGSAASLVADKALVLPHPHKKRFVHICERAQGE